MVVYAGPMDENLGRLSTELVRFVMCQQDGRTRLARQYPKVDFRKRCENGWMDGWTDE